MRVENQIRHRMTILEGNIPMAIHQYSSKDLLLIGILKECAALLTIAYEKLQDPKFQEVAEFADSAYWVLLSEMVNDETQT